VKAKTNHLRKEIEQRQLKEVELKSSEQRFRSFVENLNNVIFSLTPSGEFSYVSPQWKKNFGYELSETIGQSFVPFVHPDDAPICLAFLQQLIATGEKQSGVEFRVLRKNGTYLWYKANASLIHDSVTGTPAVVGIGRDITDSKNSEQQINRLTSLLDESQHIAHIGAWEIDLLTNTLYWTDETYRIHETDPAEYTPTIESAIAFYAPKSLPIIESAVKEAIENGNDFSLDLELITAKGKRILSGCCQGLNL
jgi:PAS domain S-box-containing protein